MINKSRIKIIIAVLFITGFSVVLYLRRPKDIWEPNWDKGYLDAAERIYYGIHVNTIIDKWKEAGTILQGQSDSQPDDYLKTLLVIDLDKKAIWIEENGRISEDDYMELPPSVNFTLYHYSSAQITHLQKGGIILKNADSKTALKSPEQLFLNGFGIKGSLQFIIIDTLAQAQAQGLYVNPPARTVASTNADDLASPFLVTKAYYQKYIDFLADSRIIQSDKENALAKELSVLEKNKAAWKRIEKMLYMEIEKNVGYQLMSVDVQPTFDFSAATASVIVFVNNPLIAFLNKSDNLFANFVIVRLDDNIWYAASDSNLQSKPSNQQLKLEFLILLNDDITQLQKQEYIKIGREKIKTIMFSQP